MRQEYVVEADQDGRLWLRLVLVPDDEPKIEQEDNSSRGVIIIEPDEDCDGEGVTILEM